MSSFSTIFPYTDLFILHNNPKQKALFSPFYREGLICIWNLGSCQQIGCVAFKPVQHCLCSLVLCHKITSSEIRKIILLRLNMLDLSMTFRSPCVTKVRSSFVYGVFGTSSIRGTIRCFQPHTPVPAELPHWSLVELKKVPGVFKSSSSSIEVQSLI